MALSHGGNMQKQETALTPFGLYSPQPFERALTSWAQQLVSLGAIDGATYSCFLSNSGCI
jgi:hypothetical protein